MLTLKIILPKKLRIPGGALSGGSEETFFSIGKVGFWWSPSTNSPIARLLHWNSSQCYTAIYSNQFVV